MTTCPPLRTERMVVPCHLPPDSLMLASRRKTDRRSYSYRIGLAQFTLAATAQRVAVALSGQHHGIANIRVPPVGQATGFSNWRMGLMLNTLKPFDYCSPLRY